MASRSSSSLCLSGPAAQAQFIPYFGKNKVKYDNFAWRVYKSPHFEVFYYPEFEQHLARLVSYLESGYLKLSTGLKHEMSQPIPAILYKTHSEFEQTNLYPTFVPEGVLAFAEPLRGRLVLPIDEPPDKLNGLIQHELTHVFAFDLIPRTLIQRDIPLWIDEGLADYFRGAWDPLDLMMIRDAAITDNVPKLSKAEFQAFSGRLVYNMGHAAFEFMESRYGKEGIRQFLYTLRKGILGGSTDDIYKQAFRTTPEEFDDAFDKWLKERFKPFRDKQQPSDYGRNLSPNPEKTHYTQVFAFAPSPSGEIVAAVTANRTEGAADIVLLSARDGSIIKNISEGVRGDYETLSMHENFVAGRWISFDPRGDSVASSGGWARGGALFLASVLGARSSSATSRGAGHAPGAVPASRRARRALRRAPRRSRGHLPPRLRDREGPEHDPGPLRGHRPADLAGRHARGLHAPYQRLRQGVLVPARRPLAQDPAHVRGLQRRRPDLLHRRQAGLLLLRRGRRHPEPAEPGPADRRHPAVHRRPGRQHGPRRRSRRRPATGSPSSPTSRASTSSTRRT